MGITKTEIFSKRQNELANLAKVLGHPARIAIIERLLELNSCVCGDLVSDIGLAQATISQHLKELKQAGLIKGSIAGTSVCYCLNQDEFVKVKELFVNLFDNIENNALNCC
ncbi:MAG: winged helix-turn-helix transcriptional regulator [Bacteroidia bacterium]